MAERPLSPHVTVYKWAYTMTLSILHRISGIALFGALIVMIVWLMAVARGPLSYAEAMSTLASAPFKCLIAIALLALCYHFFNGLRHLAWDIGLGFERAQAPNSGVLALISLITSFERSRYLRSWEATGSSSSRGSIARISLSARAASQSRATVRPCGLCSPARRMVPDESSPRSFDN